MIPAPIEIPYAWRTVRIRGRFTEHETSMLTDGTYYRRRDVFGTWKAPVPLRERWPHADAIEVDMTGDAWDEV